MSAAETLATPLTESLSWAEIQARFPYQYVVVLEEVEDISGGMATLRGRVVSHGVAPREVLRGAEPWRDPDALIGFYYTGVGMPDEDRDPLRAHR